MRPSAWPALAGAALIAASCGASGCGATLPRRMPDPVISARPVSVLVEAIQGAALLEGCTLAPVRIRPLDPVIQVASVGIECRATGCFLGTSASFATQIVVRSYDPDEPERQWFVVTLPIDAPGLDCIDAKLARILDRVRVEVEVSR